MSLFVKKKHGGYRLAAGRKKAPGVPIRLRVSQSAFDMLQKEAAERQCSVGQAAAFYIEGLFGRVDLSPKINKASHLPDRVKRLTDEEEAKLKDRLVMVSETELKKSFTYKTVRGDHIELFEFNLDFTAKHDGGFGPSIELRHANKLLDPCVVEYGGMDEARRAAFEVVFAPASDAEAIANVLGFL